MLLIANAVSFCYTCHLRLPLNADENVKPLNTDEQVASSKFSITRKYQCLLTRETDLIKVIFFMSYLDRCANSVFQCIRRVWE